MATPQLEVIVQDMKENLATVKAFEEKPYAKDARDKYAQRAIKDPENLETQGIAQEYRDMPEGEFYEMLQKEVAESQKEVIEHSRANIDSILQGLDNGDLIDLTANTIEPITDGEVSRAHKSYQKAVETIQKEDLEAMKEYLLSLIADGYEDTFKGMLSDKEAVKRMYAGVVAGRKAILAQNFADREGKLDKRSIINYANRNTRGRSKEKTGIFYLNAGINAVESEKKKAA